MKIVPWKDAWLNQKDLKGNNLYLYMKKLVPGPCLVHNCVFCLYFPVKMSTDYYFDTLKVIKNALQVKNTLEII